jgi:hypothetical protein
MAVILTALGSFSNYYMRLQKYHILVDKRSLIRLLVPVSLFFLLGIAACSYPNRSKQARDYRRQQKILQAQNPVNPLDTSANTNLKGLKTGQTDSTATATTPGKLKFTKTDSLAVQKDSFATDSLRIAADSMGLDSLARTDTDTLLSRDFQVVQLSPDSLDAPVTYEARDSMWYDIAAQKVYLFGGATMQYKDMTIKAGYIEFDFKNKIALAEGVVDSAGRRQEEPEFDMGEQNFIAQKITYNYETKKGKVSYGYTQEGEGYLRSNDSKFIQNGTPDGKHNVIYSKNALYTTCDYPEAHFGIRSSKAKIIPNKLIVIGPSYLELGGIPTPLALPFGFFPITQTRKAGIVFPRDFENSPQLGLGFKGIGWYQPLTDKIDLELTGDIYTRGSWGLHANSSYNVKYKYSGSLSLNLSSIRQGLPEDPDFNKRLEFNVRWNHNQLPTANPLHQFSASLNVGTSTYFSNTTTDLNLRNQNNFNSSIRYTRIFPSLPFQFNAGFEHNQNRANRSISVSFPRMDFALTQIYPFKRKNPVGKKRWYEEIGFRYSANFLNRIDTQDSLLFSDKFVSEVVNKSQYGIRHSPEVSMNFNLFKYLKLSPRVQYNERWYFYRNKQEFDPTAIITDTTEVNGLQRIDTTQFGKINTVRDYGFYALRELSAGANLSTTLFGLANLNWGPLKAVRHTMSPSIGFNWSPDYKQPAWNVYDSVAFDLRYQDSLQAYNQFQNMIFGAPSGGAAALINFGISNSFEAKVRDKRDSTSTDGYRKVPLLNSLSLGGNYNFLADSLKLSPISVNGSTALFKKINVSFNMTFDPYKRVEGKRIDDFLIKSDKKLARLDYVGINIGTSFSGDELSNIFKKQKTPAPKPGNPNQAPMGFKLIETMNVAYNLSLRNTYQNNTDTLIAIQTLRIGSKMRISTNWSLNYSFSYDFQNKRIAQPSLELERILHCWRLTFGWQPEQQTWNFSLFANSSTLDFLKFPARKNIFDPF